MGCWSPRTGTSTLLVHGTYALRVALCADLSRLIMALARELEDGKLRGVAAIVNAHRESTRKRYDALGVFILIFTHSQRKSNAYDFPPFQWFLSSIHILP